MRGTTEYLDSEAINKELISIHAPMRGTTVLGRVPAGVPIISIHAPMRGTT